MNLILNKNIVIKKKQNGTRKKLNFNSIVSPNKPIIKGKNPIPVTPKHVSNIVSIVLSVSKSSFAIERIVGQKNDMDIPDRKSRMKKIIILLVTGKITVTTIPRIPETIINIFMLIIWDSFATTKRPKAIAIEKLTIAMAPIRGNES